jgi:hypothetical protein
VASAREVRRQPPGGILYSRDTHHQVGYYIRAMPTSRSNVRAFSVWLRHI